MPHVTSADGTTIAYDKRGEGPPLVIVDGALCSRRFGPSEAQAARLAERFTVYIYDRRGRGESGDRPPYAVEREIEDLAALIDAAGGSAFVYGISVGSVLALRAAAALGPDRLPRLALCEPPFSVGDEAEAAFAQETRHMMGLLAAGRRGEAVSTFLSEIMPPPMLDELRASPDWALLEAHAPTLAYDYTLLGDGAVPAAIARAVEIPVLLLVGEESAAYKHTASKELVKALPQVKLEATVGEGFEPTDELIDSLVRFFTLARAA
jgi:pimeloyl-ACP methyl ester carboxylesterase